MRRTPLPVLLATAALAVLAACSGSSGGQTATATATPQEPQTIEAARTLIDKALGRALAGDHAGVWELYVREDKALIGRDDYVAYQTTCNADAPTGLPYELTDVRLDSPTKTVGIATVAGTGFPVEAYYQDGRWLTTLTDENRAGAQQWVATKGCQPTS